MNSIFSNKTSRLAIKTTAKLFIPVLVALACIATPLTAFACTRAEFATILQGFCQAFKADLLRQIGSSQFNEIINGNSVKGVLESYKGFNDSKVDNFERSEIRIASRDFSHTSDTNGSYTPEACGLGNNRNTQQDASDFHYYINSSEYQNLDIGYIDSMFTDAVRAAGASTTNTINENHNPGSNNVVEPKFHTNSTAINGGPCDDRLVKTTSAPPVHTTFYTLTVGSAPQACNDSVTWNFSGRTTGKTCTFHINPLSQTFTLTFIDSDGNQIDSVTTDPSQVLSRQENDVKKVELDFSRLSNTTLKLGGIRYTNCQ